MGVRAYCGVTESLPRPRPMRVQVARELRARMTRSETLLWRELRARQLDGAKFRRQHPLGPFFLDFYCEAHRLAIEVDGSAHESASARRYDAERQALIESAGIRVLRVRSGDVERNLKDVLAAIRAALTPGPSPT